MKDFLYFIKFINYSLLTILFLSDIAILILVSNNLITNLFIGLTLLFVNYSFDSYIL